MQAVRIPENIGSIIANLTPMPQQHCQYHGHYYGEVGDPCDSCAWENEMRERAMFARCEDMGLAAKYHRLQFGDYWQHHEKHRNVLDLARRFVAGEFKSLVFCGGSDFNARNRKGFGTGKTTAAAMILYEFYLAGKGLGLYSQAPKISRAVKDVMDTTNKMSREQLVASYEKPPLLVIDELGANDLTKPDKELFSEIIANRLEADRATIIISNEPKEYLETCLHERVISRIIGSGQRCVFDWQDARRTA